MIEQVTEEYVGRIFDRTIDIINKFGARLCGTDACLDTSEYLKNDMDKVCDKTYFQDFKCCPEAFLNWIRLTNYVYMLFIPFLYFDLQIVNIVLGIFGVSTLILEFVSYVEYLDWFYPKRRGRNVIGIVEPKEEAKVNIIFSGHHDSAYLFTFYQYKSYWIYIKCYSALISFLIAVAFSAFQMYLKYYDLPQFLKMFSKELLVKYMNIFLIIASPVALQTWNFTEKEGSLGAGDNMIVSSIGIELARYFKKNRLKWVRFYCVSFDAEECGLRGSRAFFGEYADELKKLPTFHVNADSLFFKDEIRLMLSDLNGFIKTDREMVNDFQKIADKFSIPTKQEHFPLFFGATDSAEALARKIPSFSIIGLPFKIDKYPPVYHTRLDRPEYIDKEIIQRVFLLVTYYIGMKDSSFGKQPLIHVNIVE